MAVSRACSLLPTLPTPTIPTARSPRAQPSRSGVAAWCTGEVDIALRQRRLVDMVGANGARTHKTYGAIGKQLIVDLGNGAHDERVGIPKVGGVYLPPWHTGERTEMAEAVLGSGDIGVDDKFHRRLGIRALQYRPRRLDGQASLKAIF